MKTTMALKCNAPQFAKVITHMFLLGLTSGLLAAPIAASAQTASGAHHAPAAKQQVIPSKQVWRRAMQRIRLPRTGCFTSSYPALAWKETPCNTPPARSFTPTFKRYLRSTGNTEQVGDGNDISAQVSGSPNISSATGNFPTVTDVTSVTSSNTGSVPDAFSLQLNSSFFSTPACNAAQTPSGCLGWQQFVFLNSINGGSLYIEYWLLGFGRPCPPNWMVPPASADLPSDCFLNSPATNVTGQTVANLEALSLTGSAESNGLDTLVMTTANGDLAAMSQNDNVLTLSKGWQVAEYNIFGYNNGVEATFNNGATIVVATSVTNGTTNEPAAVNEGFTAESNNLNLVFPACRYGGPSPTIVFKESTVTPTTFTCPKPLDTCKDLTALIAFDQKQLANAQARRHTPQCGGQALFLCTQTIRADGAALADAEAEYRKYCAAP